MMIFFWLIGWLVGLLTLAYHQPSRQVITVSLIAGYFFTLLFADLGFILHLLLLILVTSIILFINLDIQRRKIITQPLLKEFIKHLPKISKTEREALEAGTVWWDKELFSGRPNWKNLLDLPAPKLTPEEQAFIDGPVETLCRMINEWEINKHQDLTPMIWSFLKENQFFGLIIPKIYGGLQFSALAHSEILAKIASCSLTVASTVAVPNSLGPAELIYRYGTDDQKNFYLPRLASGEEIPCFALTNPEAGSDATNLPDTGVICRDKFKGTEILGIRLNWDKRYITLAPMATLLGLAFKLYDPDHLIGSKTEIGITCALIPTHTPGISIGRRHKPLLTPFQNGPTQGKDVFIPLDWIIGGSNMLGLGWRMLVECLSSGRAISLPSAASGSIKLLAAMTGAYARIRRQFKQPIGYFEGIEEPLARMAGNAYLAESARITTAASIDRGEAPSVLGAIIKYHLTERYRQATLDAMDVHGGKGIMLGPRNIIAHYFINSPISITVEGSNILTRCMIIFGQGALKSHPYLVEEFRIATGEFNENTIDKFDQMMMKHLRYSMSNIARAFVGAITQLKWSSQYIPAINRASASFALVADCCMLILGGKLKFKEKISSRLSDMLSMMYLASCALKHFRDQGEIPKDKPLLEWVIRDTLSTFWIQMEDLLRNFPTRWVGLLLRCIVMPFGKRVHTPNDGLGHEVASILMSPNDTRSRLLQGIYLNIDENKPNGVVERAFAKIIEAEHEHASASIKKEADALRREVIAVDHFS